MERLRALAGRVAAPFVREAGAVAALVAGSVATGTTDEWSDVDLILFYDLWPGSSALARTREALSPTERVILGGDDGGDGDVLLEQFRVDGTACQLVHQTLDAWRAASATVLVDLDTSTPTQKALSGLHAGVVLHGGDVIEELRAASAYPASLRAAMVRDHLDVFPLWRMADALAVRDAELWQRSELVAGFSKVLAVLAGVNEVYFSMFQLKHTRQLVGAFRWAPAGLVDRIEGALSAPMPEAAAELQRVLDETLAIVSRQLPDVDVSVLQRRVSPR